MDVFPFTEIRVGVQMEEPREAEAKRKLIAKKEERLAKLRSLSLEIEEFICSIEDSETRMIFEYTFKDGRTQTEIGEILHLDRSRVSRKISDYLEKTHTKHTKRVI